ncbi:cutinase [Jatrophihabitans sp. GAS493]|uniref:cutinase family protein n=1 Tax=Jatrophihabitans sp. GAS493 TaxID=1907575 RepID=UPI000BB6D222|nr:cutinase family protein [Jatrophihabitans sp. GAS493]SOD72565.1 cutinase [Jatrophihabitans sp. GAS493]
MPRTTPRRAIAAVAGAAALIVSTLVVGSQAVGAAPAAATCTKARFIVAKGTSEFGTLGFIVGDRINDQLTSKAPGVFTSEAVNYPGTTDADSPVKGDVAVVAAVTAAIAACPNQKIVISGYSQGAQIVDEAFGIDMTGTINGGPPTAVLPASARSHVAAVVLFGNPLGSIGKKVTGPYASVTKEWCASGDPVCNPNQINILAHLSYFLNASDAATYILAKI